ncbi:MAG: TatD family hydrolase, partial [Spirochaetaceae bacterium]|nr:TatD family hydrolase [Spirochaetaceae bacterium]
LTDLAKDGKIDFVGEAGFDLFGDTPLRIRNEKNLAEQKRAFEYQMNLAIRYSLPIVVHSRKATDILMGYGRTLAQVPAVIFHCWPGRLVEAEAFLGKGVQAYFSFGTPILRNGRHAVESCAGLPPDRLLSETDAPFQPPYGEQWTHCGHLKAITAKIAAVRAIPEDEASDLLYRNFKTAFGTEI